MRAETLEEQEACKWADLHDIPHLKLNLIGNRGWPDRLFIFANGVTVWVEFKRQGEEPEPLQWSRVRTLLRKGHHVYYVDSAKSAIAILEATSLHENGREVDDLASLRWPIA